MFVVKPAQKVRIGVETPSGQILQFYSYIKKIESDRLLLVFSESKAHLVKYLQEGTLIKISIYTPSGIILQDSIILNTPVNCEFEAEFGSKRLLASLSERLSEKRISVELTDKTKAYIIEKAYDPIYGARPLKRFIGANVETLIAKLIIAEDIAPDSEIIIDYDRELTAKLK